MILYHFTRERFLPAIAEHGLLPQVGEGVEFVLSLGTPVVWLTSDGAKPRWWRRDDDCRLVVKVGGKHLAHWRSWMAQARTVVMTPRGITCGPDVLAACRDDQPSVWPLTDSWYVYFRTIPPARIQRAAKSGAA